MAFKKFLKKLNVTGRKPKKQDGQFSQNQEVSSLKKRPKLILKFKLFVSNKKNFLMLCCSNCTTMKDLKE